MKLFKISQTQNNGYDTFDSAVVAAPSASAARKILPRTDEVFPDWPSQSFTGWASDPNQVTAVYVGEASPGTKQGTIVASFNAG
jgi:hypothetical protein